MTKQEGFIGGLEAESQALLDVAKKMLIAARTAPKARGIDKLVTGIITPGPVLEKLRAKMEELAPEGGALFNRDSQNIKDVEAVVLIGTKKGPMGLKLCGLCGFASCEEMEAQGATCIYNPGDLGIAVGSAVSVAMDHRVDNRVMYTIGLAAVKLGLLGENVDIAFGIPLAVRGKNPFFDRK
ncbi:MAG: ferredoxin domain-containing protein [Limnochordia bacterium]